MKICFFGIYDPSYARTRVLKRAFETKNYEVVECRVDPRKYPGVRKWFVLAREWWRLPDKRFDRLLVCYPGQSVVWLARLLYGKPPIFDAFLSLYDSNVFDRKVYPKWHPRAIYDWFLDWSSARLASNILLDTAEHINYFVSTFHLPRDKFIRVFIGADEEIFYPQATPESASTFLVHFHGMFIPLQGLKYIVGAAALLQDYPILFQIVGAGQEYKLITEQVANLGLSNLKFTGKVPIESIPKYIAEAGVCLGIFGDTEKTGRVIPNKVYEYAAMGKPIITAETPAICEVFTQNVDVLLCKPADSDSLAKAIKELALNTEKALKLGRAARETFDRLLTAQKLGRDLIKQI